MRQIFLDTETTGLSAATGDRDGRLVDVAGNARKRTDRFTASLGGKRTLLVRIGYPIVR